MSALRLDDTHHVQRERQPVIQRQCAPKIGPRPFQVTGPQGDDGQVLIGGGVVRMDREYPLELRFCSAEVPAVGEGDSVRVDHVRVLSIGKRTEDFQRFF